MSTLKATEVFTPGSFPTYTYVERGEKELESRLDDGLATPGQVISLSGPSKSGKTVLIEKVVTRDNLIVITGAGLESADELWDRVLDWMEVPSEETENEGSGTDAGVSAELGGSVQVPLVAKGEGKASGDVRRRRSEGRGTKRLRRGLPQVVDEIAESEFVLLVDDFHYMPRSAQDDVAKQIKEAARSKVRIVTASVPHRSDDVVRANPELRGRVLAIDLDYWEHDNLRKIADVGFDLLNVELDRSTLEHFVNEAAGSPQLMQAICLNACFQLGYREQQEDRAEKTLNRSTREEVLQRTALTTDFRSLVDTLDSGPKTRGTERKTYVFTDGTEGDVYRCILKAMASDPPALSFDYDAILQRNQNVCSGEAPAGSSVLGSCSQLGRLAQEKFPKERVIDWDEQKQVLDIADPYLLFYLRWSGRLME